MAALAEGSMSGQSRVAARRFARAEDEHSIGVAATANPLPVGTR